MAPVSKERREAAIVAYIGRCGGSVGSTVAEVRKALLDPGWLGDAASAQSYHKTFARLVARGVLTAANPGGRPVRYLVTERWRLSLEDVGDLGLRAAAFPTDHANALTPETYAAYLDGQLLFHENWQDVLTKAALGLMEEDPVDLVLAMFKHKVEHCNEMIRAVRTSGGSQVNLERLRLAVERLRLLVHSGYGISACDFPTVGPREAIRGVEFAPDWDRVRSALQQRVFGERFLSWLDVGGADSATRPFVVAGSDGSAHSQRVDGFSGQGLFDDDGLILTFNNSLAAYDLTDLLRGAFEYPYHTVPFNREAFRSPDNAAIVMARVWYQDVDDADYEHLKQAALALVQSRVDVRVLAGTAEVVGGAASANGRQGKRLPKPVVYFRDGPVTPQGRELQWSFYSADDLRGEWFRELINLWWMMLQSVANSERLVAVGVVKSTQLTAFAELVGWYVAFGSSARHIRGKPDGRAIAPEWGDMTAWRINDHQVMTLLMAAVVAELDPDGELMKQGRYIRSCVVLRPFPQLSSDLRYLRLSDDEYVGYFQDLRRRAVDARKTFGGDVGYLELVEIEDEPYVQLCRKGDYCSFYVGHTGGAPAPLLPRYEFMDTLRLRGDVGVMRTRIMDRVALIVQAIHDGGLVQDRDHDFMRRDVITRLVPFTVYDAHEKSKVWGDYLTKGFLAAVFAQLAELRSTTVDDGGMSLTPLSLSDYVRSVERALGGNRQQELF